MNATKARKQYMCAWCAEDIYVGDQYVSYTTFVNGPQRVRMHRECYEAMQKAELQDDELPPAGLFSRGCWCGDVENCTCKKAREGE